MVCLLTRTCTSSSNQTQRLISNPSQTFVLVSTVYSVAMGEPTFGNVGPLAVGLSLFASAIAGGGFTGAALNPARVLGPAIAWGCNWQQAWVYILAELVGGAAAGLLSGPLYGWYAFGLLVWAVFCG